MATVSGIVKVDEEKLHETATKAKKSIRKYRKSLEEMGTLIQNTGSFWEGEGGSHYRQIFWTQKSNVEAMLEEYKEYADRLLDQEGKVIQARKAAQSKAETLNSIKL